MAKKRTIKGSRSTHVESIRHKDNERGESRSFDFLRGKFRLLMDLDDKRNRECGEWYSDANPLSGEKNSARSTLGSWH